MQTIAKVPAPIVCLIALPLLADVWCLSISFGARDQSRQLIENVALNADLKTALSAVLSGAEHLLIAMVVLHLISAALLLWLLYRLVFKRLQVTLTNARRIASDTSLSPPMKGEDTISKIDQSMHTLVVSLREAHRRARAIIDNARDVICAIDTSGNFIMASPAAEAIFGYLPEELGQLTYESVIYRDDLVQAKESISAIVKNKVASSFEARIKRKDGSLLDTLWSAHWSDLEKSIFCVVHDISEQKEAERMKQEVVAMITHDLRTPLTTLLTFMEMLEQGALVELDEKTERLLTNAQRSGKRMMDLINDLLDIEKIKAGMLELDVQEVSITSVFEQSARPLQEWGADRGVTVHVSPSDLQVAVDESQICRVVSNLVSNAVKFTPKGGSVDISARLKDGMVEVSVSDTGRGIPAHLLDSIFDRFQQVQSSDAKQHGGSGLGLAICKAIVELHGGSISVRSSEGQGTTFRFTVPAAEKAH
ncbi:MAG TPA: ATP-binding protein [Candidatus Obscuribacterales bacterium]